MGKSVLILGGSSDISIALAHKLASDGYDIQLVVRNITAIKRIESDIELRYRVNVNSFYFDVLDMDSIDLFLDKLPCLPVIVISAVGFLEREISIKDDVETVRKVIDTNFTGPALFLEAAARRLSKLKTQTAVIGISSVAGDRGRNKNYWYGAAKSGLTSSLSAMRQKYNKSNLHVMTVCLGFVNTRMTEGLDLPKLLISSPEDTADLILRSLKKKTNIVYNWKWFVVMTIIKCIPEKIFKRLSF